MGVTHVCQQLDAVLDSMHTARRKELLHRYRLGRVNEPSIDPVLQTVQIKRGHLLAQPVVHPVSTRRSTAQERRTDC